MNSDASACYRHAYEFVPFSERCRNVSWIDKKMWLDTETRDRERVSERWPCFKRRTAGQRREEIVVEHGGTPMRRSTMLFKLIIYAVWHMCSSTLVLIWMV